MKTVNGKHSCGAMILAISILTSSGIAKTPPGAKRQWPVPLPASTHVALHVAAEGRLAFLVSRTADRAAVCHVFDTNNGKIKDLRTAQIGADEASFDTFLPSSDGKYLLLAHGGRSALRKMLRTHYVLTLATGAVRKLGEAGHSALRAAWAGGKLYTSHLVMPRGDVLEPIGVFDAATGTSADLKVYGVVAAVEPRQKLVVCLCDATAPTRPMKLNRITAQMSALAVVTTEGKLSTQLCPRRALWGRAVLSPGGRFVACMRVQERLLGQRPRTIIQIWDITGGQKRAIPENETLLAVTDTGAVVTERAAGRGRLKTIKLRPLKTAGRTLAQDARTAAVAGGTLFYTTGTQKLVLEAVPLAGKP